MDSSEIQSGKVIDTRFGKLTVTYDKPILFEKGLLGMSEKTQYCLLDFPVKKFAQFKLLQSLEDTKLSFITLPLQADNEFINKEDVQQACDDLQIPLEDLTILLVVTVQRAQELVSLSVNARAPIFIHSEKRFAEQYVLRNNAYEVRQPLSLPQQ
jgi:flagellar assembly factor FliW